jgi:aminodeoxyfutalosine deaminase
MRAEDVPGFLQSPFAMQVQIEFRDDGGKAVGIVHHRLSTVPGFDLKPVGRRLASQGRGVEPVRMDLSHRNNGVFKDNAGRPGLREEGADGPSGYFLVCIDGVRPEHAKSVAVISTNDCFHFGCSHGNFDYMALTELHLHLEGTVDRETVMTLDPGVSREAVDAAWAFTDFGGFLECFKFIAQRLRGPQDYGLITRRMMENLAHQGITYAEVTLGAGVVLWRGFDFHSVWRAIREAQRDAQQKWPVEVWWNLDAIRQFGPDHVMEVARLAANYVGDGAISFGIGGDEIGGPALPLRDAFAYARDAGLRLTAHAGETAGPESIRAAIEIGAERIGHGIRAVDDVDLMRQLREEQIPLEVCITSNVRTGAVASLDAHPIRRLFDAGVPITINTDDPGVFETDLGREFLLARNSFGFSEAELAQVMAAANRFRFSEKR